MPDASEILARVRARGANLVLADGKLRIVNADKLGQDGTAFVRANAKAIGALLKEEHEAEFDERAGIIEFDGKAPREWAERFAEILCRTRPRGVSDLDWSWFITTCGRIIDEAPQAQARAA
ncbi:hypothetical protein [Antarcticirhabdus aurantiaca]|uniref:Uncharacterized protein n=1 Tax=Antarcticirhabdus aurantiaca TaxID=2606717 RepID=A0ACD4NLA4_9HYPH|nr:hypothetical protein OXU80_22380 [Jeongeuplla avenae]